MTSSGFWPNSSRARRWRSRSQHWSSCSSSCCSRASLGGVERVATRRAGRRGGAVPRSMSSSDPSREPLRRSWLLRLLPQPSRSPMRSCPLWPSSSTRLVGPATDDGTRFAHLVSDTSLGRAARVRRGASHSRARSGSTHDHYDVPASWWAVGRRATARPSVTTRELVSSASCRRAPPQPLTRCTWIEHRFDPEEEERAEQQAGEDVGRPVHAEVHPARGDRQDHVAPRTRPTSTRSDACA